MKAMIARAIVTARLPVAVRSQGLNGKGNRPIAFENRMKKNSVQKKGNIFRPRSWPSQG